MMNEKKISVIVPVYNVEAYIGKCIESIINQTYKNIEIILVNDGSPDRSGTICDDYAKKDSRIKVIHKINNGVSAARNTGIDAATGDYICFVDGDDYVMDDYVAYLYGIIVEHGVDISISTKLMSDFEPSQNKKDKIQIYSPEKATVEILSYNINIGVYNKMFRRAFLGETLRFKEDLYVGEGFNFNTAAFQRANKIGVGQKQIYFYRKDNPTSVTSKFNYEKWNNGLWALEVIHNDFILHSKKIEHAWKFANWRTHTDAYDLLVIAGEEKEYPDMYKKCIKIIHTKALYSLIVPTSFQNKVRAMIMMVYPKAIPWLMIQRRKKHNIHI